MIEGGEDYEVADVFARDNGSDDFVGKWIKSNCVDIVIPVYNGFDYLGPLFESLSRNTCGDYRIIVVDDCSPDARVLPFLRDVGKKFRNYVLVENRANLGFVGAVNRAVESLSSDIFVLLNTDTEVPADWLRRLLAPMLLDPSVASATPFSNCATICSFPNFVQDNDLYLGLNTDEIDSGFAGLPLSPVEIPTGVGFCMAIKRRVVQDLGMFDIAYGKGYGEENDWCMRASSAGYKHILVNNLFVYHKHGGSFPSAEKMALIERNHKLLLSRYPAYDRIVQEHIKKDPAKIFRMLAKMSLAWKQSGVRAVLVVDHDLGGGANHYRKELVESYVGKGVPVMVFTDNSINKKISLGIDYLDERIDLRLDSVNDLDELFGLVQVSKIYYNNAVASASPLAVGGKISELARKYRLELVVLIHDFYPVCPSYTLLNSEGSYCEVPTDLESCVKCLPNIPPKVASFMPRNASIFEWRAVWGEVLATASLVKCFSENSREIIAKAYPEILGNIEVVPHVLSKKPRLPKISRGQAMHIGVVGGINYQKGLDVVLGIVKAIKSDRWRNNGIKITVIGEVDARLPIDGLAVTGRYDKDALPKVIEGCGANVFLFPSIWPETFSYVVAELMQMDVRVACFDLGAPADRVRTYSKGCILPDNDPDAILERLVQMHKNIH